MPNVKQPAFGECRFPSSLVIQAKLAKHPRMIEMFSQMGVENMRGVVKTLGQNFGEQVFHFDLDEKGRKGMYGTASFRDKVFHVIQPCIANHQTFFRAVEDEEYSPHGEIAYILISEISSRQPLKSTPSVKEVDYRYSHQKLVSLFA
jgi:hypothetical protein